MTRPISSDLAARLRPPTGLDLSPAWLEWLGDVLSAPDEAPLPALPSGWTEELPALLAHRLGPLLHTRLRAHAFLEPTGFLDALAEPFQTSAVRTLRMEAELQRIVAALAEANVPCLLLKGAALGRLVYASPAERPVSDLDLLVPRVGLAPAARVLEGLGFRILGFSPASLFGQSFYRYRAELPAVGACPANQGLLVELHWSLAELPYYIDRIDMADVWEHARPLPSLPPAQVPDPAVLLLHACAHLALHHSRDLRLIWLVDVDRLVRCGMDWERVVGLARRWGLGLAAAACLSAAARWLGTPLPAPVHDALAGLATDKIGRAMWGLGDERLPGRWWRRPWATWAAFDTGGRVRYAGWLALRTLLKPVEWVTRR